MGVEVTYGLNGSYFAELLCLCHRNRHGFMSLHVDLPVEPVPVRPSFLHRRHCIVSGIACQDGRSR
jgi:hypothetical protein